MTRFKRSTQEERSWRRQAPELGPYGPPPPCTLDSCALAREWPVPGEEECRALWDKYAMPEHIREHSLAVADLATCLAEQGAKRGVPLRVDEVRASALLHDLAKDYTIRHGGNHAQLGGAWVQEETGNPAIAQGVTHHVYWPWDVDVDKYFLCLAVIYGDKRVRHHQVVTVAERYEDLFERYGKSAQIREKIELSRIQTLDIEESLSKRLGVGLHACTYDCGRLVQRT